MRERRLIALALEPQLWQLRATLETLRAMVGAPDPALARLESRLDILAVRWSTSEYRRGASLVDSWRGELAPHLFDAGRVLGHMSTTLARIERLFVASPQSCSELGECVPLSIYLALPLLEAVGGVRWQPPVRRALPFCESRLLAIASLAVALRGVAELVAGDASADLSVTFESVGDTVSVTIHAQTRHHTTAVFVAEALRVLLEASPATDIGHGAGHLVLAWKTTGATSPTADDGPPTLRIAPGRPS